ncbi:coilin [Mercurialis annua]|uniref:coilin n=1 Tax=Mercurialis annua TaxID=3986 RepID=UPI00215FEA28|nr:coilin [Mercurialis annua]
METVRLRLVFDHILSKLQDTQGLKRCWVLLKPQHQTISDLSSYLLNAFSLQNHCPRGLLLSMEGFALPGFESTSIFKDKDIIRVEKNGGLDSEMVMLGDEVNNALEVVEIVETQPVATTGMNLLANEEFEKECGGYLSDEEEDEVKQEDEPLREENGGEVKTVSKKRKAVKKLKSPKKKKTKKSSSSEKCVTPVKDKGKKVCCEQNGTLSIPEVGEKSQRNKALSEAKSFSRPLENGDASMDGSPSTGAIKKSSRSARRKQAIRRRKKEERIAMLKEQQQRVLRGNSPRKASENDNQSLSQPLAKKVNQESPKESSDESSEESSEELPERDGEKLQEDGQQTEIDSDLEDDVVPIVIRPGHIRFEPLSKVHAADQTVQQPQISVETFQWNGITSKKKGQKWGTEKAASYKRNDYRNSNQECAVSYKRNDYRNFNQGECSNSKMWHDGAKPAVDRIDFEKLEFYTTSPKVGDVIAYRLIELSSSWTPELSSYQVGKISTYDMRANRVRLVPVPGYPVISEEPDGDASAIQGTTHYAKDGSLWIDFSSLLEVRLVTQVNSNSVKPIAGGVDEVSVREQDNATGSRSNNGNESHAPVQENGKVNSWEDISQALDAKKAELAQEDKWNKAESSGKKPWSYRALRGSALGPTMALLRSQNEL